MFARLQDVGTIDSETSNKRADRKAALRRQQHLLREDIENLHARALQQVLFDKFSDEQPVKRHFYIRASKGCQLAPLMFIVFYEA